MGLSSDHKAPLSCVFSTLKISLPKYLRTPFVFHLFPISARGFLKSNLQNAFDGHSRVGKIPAKISLAVGHLKNAEKEPNIFTPAEQIRLCVKKRVGEEEKKTKLVFAREEKNEEAPPKALVIHSEIKEIHLGN